MHLSICNCLHFLVLLYFFHELEISQIELQLGTSFLKFGLIRIAPAEGCLQCLVDLVGAGLIADSLELLEDLIGLNENVNVAEDPDACLLGEALGS